MLVAVQAPLYKHIADLVGKSATTLPVPAITVINGGKHAGNGLPIQVFLQTFRIWEVEGIILLFCPLESSFA